MTVFVLDQQQKPLMPCSEKRARYLLARKRAVVHHLEPFCIRLKDRRVEESEVQSVVLKIDPGSRTTGLALARADQTEAGEIHHALHLAHLHHRGEAVHSAMQRRACYRRRRRSVNLRYRAPRFLNRRRPAGWLPPSLKSRIGNILTWAKRYQRWVPLTSIYVERVRFDTQLIQNAEISGEEYQRGELAGWEIRAYLLEKWAGRCAYCGQTTGGLEVDHMIPRSRCGTNRVSNLVLACHACNQEKGNRTAAEYGYSKIEMQAKKPLKDAAAVNITRVALAEVLRGLSMPVETWSGGRTRWNRDRFGIPKVHSFDALCVGEIAGVRPGRARTLEIRAQGRGRYGRTLVTGTGFPRGFLMQHKRVKGFQTGDLVQAEVPERFKTHGTHRGRVAVRANGSFRVGKIDGINARYCRLLQRNDGYEIALLPDQGENLPQSTR